MITLNNSNIDFDLDKKILAREYSILLDETSCNFIFRTYGEDRMTIMSSGNIGVGLANPTAPLEVSGIIKATGAIISTGSGFQGKGVNLTEIPITGVLNLLPTLQGLSGNVGSVELNIESTSNNLVNRILEETTYGSNYTLRSNRELNTRIDYTSNYVFSASNFLVNRIVMEIGQTSNYILTASNNLVNRAVIEAGFGSNYLFRLDTNASNYILTASNNLVNRAVIEAGFGSNYLFRLDTNASNYILTASNNLVNRAVIEAGFGSNYLFRLDTNASNYILTASNNLVNRAVIEAGFGSNYLFRLDTNASNYILTASNNLVNRAVIEAGFGSNYLLRLDTNASNYILSASNNLVNRAVIEAGFGSNYLFRLDTNASNYILTASNNLVKRIVEETGFGSNYARDRVGIWSSNYTDLTSKWTSNYVDKLNAIAIVSSQWTTNAAASIYYNTGGVGIGTANPIANLHIYSSNNSTNSGLASTKFVIQEANNSNLFSTIATDIISTPTVVPLSIAGSIDKYVVFTYTTDNTGFGQTAYSITLPENYSYDVLMVGGGGGGGGDLGAGGGGGAVLYGSNIRIPAGSYNIKVGNGGNGTGQNGYNTEAFNSLCFGGGGAANIGAINGNDGGSGAGGKSGTVGSAGEVIPSIKGALLQTAIIFGNKGGAGAVGGGSFQSAGGGGAGEVGKAGTTPAAPFTGSANGGSGIQLNITGAALFWGAGGGGAGNAMIGGNGGNGGGGAGTRSGTGSGDSSVGGNAYSTAVGMNAAFGSGSGGGGGSANFQSNGGNGGAGIIIIRYRPLINISGTPEMQLVIGDRIEAGASNYKLGNYNGKFQIKTTTSNIDTTSLIIESLGNVGIGTSIITSKLHLYDSQQNAILTLQDNTSIPTLMPPTSINPIVVGATSSITPSAIGLYDKIVSCEYSSDSTGLTGQTQYIFTASEDISADILVVGGGGGGGCFGGGGGGGQVLLTTNYIISSGNQVIINVGKGGTGGTAGTVSPAVAPANGQNGFDTSITIAGNTFIAKGGGGGGTSNTDSKTLAGSNGGSGGGSSSGILTPATLGGISTKNTYLNWKSFGNKGGIGSYKPTSGATANHFGGGGGGAGYNGGTAIYSASTTGTTIGTAGSGGEGINLSSIFGTSFGETGNFGGGGGGMLFGYGTVGSGGLGGGGRGGTGVSSTGTAGTVRTGGGGGGGSGIGGGGGTGVVIIRYRQKNIEGSSELQLIKGASISSGNTNYKIGNYGGDYKVKSSSYNTDMDRFVIEATGNTVFNNTNGIAVATVFNNGDFRTAGSQISDSDHRIKKDVANIDDDAALRMILAIEPKTYRYIDDERGRNGANCANSDLIYGFIAQQIRDVIPDATELRKNFLPNIMKRAICDNDRVYLDLTGYRDLPVKDTERKINIRFKNGGGYNFSITEVNTEYFVIDNNDRLIEEVFVYGYEVNDFHILTKDYIYTLNVSATRELHRKMLEQEGRIKELEDRLR